MKNELSPATQEHLLDLANKLMTTLRDAPIYLVSAANKGEADSLGVPASCVSHATSFLYQERDLEKFRSFIQRLDRLDTMTGQNLENPRAQHAALKRVLRPWIKTHSDLSADECLYVLAWVRRLLPKVSRQGPPTKSGQSKAKMSPPTKGNQMMAALLRAQEQRKR